MGNCFSISKGNKNDQGLSERNIGSRGAQFKPDTVCLCSCK